MFEKTLDFFLNISVETTDKKNTCLQLNKPRKIGIAKTETNKKLFLHLRYPEPLMKREQIKFKLFVVSNTSFYIGF